MLYLVCSPIVWDRRYEPGETIEPIDGDAELWLDLGIIDHMQEGDDPEGDSEIPSGEPATARHRAIVAAIGRLDRDDLNAWTTGGRPKVGALESVLGAGITSAERDAAWAEVGDDLRHP